MKNLISIVLLYFLSTSAIANERAKALWTEFYDAAKAQKFDEPVKIYESDSEYKKICFIYKKQVWFFQDGKIKQSIHAKVFNVDGINRISYQQEKDGGSFVLWSNEEIVISFGS